MKKRAVCVLACMSIIAKINSQEVKFGWSFGDFGWSYDFIGKRDVADANILRFILSFEKMNLMLNTAILYGTNKNNRKEMEPFYNSFFPLEIVYSPFKWKYAHLAAYGRAAWEIEYRGDIEDASPISNGFFGSLGCRIGLFPKESALFKYKFYVLAIFSEYTTRNEFKLGASIDFFDLVYFWLMLRPANNANKELHDT
ncbi:MAG: hypothetical protein LBK63_10320 [Treponema sp.]|jgi:hypothetical protein|nr:hypothetical protein [Treponema sp.]